MKKEKGGEEKSKGGLLEGRRREREGIWNGKNGRNGIGEKARRRREIEGNTNFQAELHLQYK